MTEVTKTAPKFLQKALDSLKVLGVGSPDTGTAPIVDLLKRISDVDEDRVLVIARTLSHQQNFDSLVANQISQINFGNRFDEIVKRFDSIRDDSKRLVVQAERSAPTLGDRVSNVVMKLTRGDISDRFDAIRKTFDAVIKDVGSQVQRESAILEAYADFRSSIKEAEIIAYEVKALLDEDLKAAQAKVADAMTLVQQASDASPQEKSRLELERDEAQRAAKAVEDRWQIATDLANNLQVSYSVTEVTMAKLAESHMAKDRLFKQSVAFMSTNSSVLTALKATYTGLLGLHEATQALDAMHDGISKSLESIADVGTKVTENALRKGYGPSIRAQSVKKLVDSVVEFQENSTKIIADMRKDSEQNAKEIRDYVEDGKRRIADLVASGKAPGLTVNA
ncbi:cell surface protein [Mesorhizobium sp. SP-1A]|uniref:cell surface protein n=1 Tax=Mesorhizobium sp. SP-1A TaxID=3077840 RepID=UPI0028F70BF1|nr:cell surface protein [Mesorhizobium sp. SP-1A]